ncbi:bacillithiol biosynthesis deacetylase BshB1 [Limibacter armeniacum]|uniref:bacillithiol biosynthesis deacetylase BshB1 n=1 Tax=Limibacter armeniacum TaxID=466084 RepID=UPI002FE53836
MKLDILVLVAHPDDAELACSGTILKAISQGHKVGIVDYTKGEMGTRGTPEIRMQEAADSAKILGLHARENLGFSDVFFTNDKAHQLEVAKIIRKYRPDIVITNAIEDRHPDHGKASQLTVDACFISGLKMVKTELDGKAQEAWRPKNIFHIIQSTYLAPDFVIDVTDFWEGKEASIRAFKSQFHTGSSESDKGDQTFISSPEFMEFIKSRAREYGQHVGAKYAEGFTKASPIIVNDLFDLV